MIYCLQTHSSVIAVVKSGCCCSLGEITCCVICGWTFPVTLIDCFVNIVFTVYICHRFCDCVVIRGELYSTIYSDYQLIHVHNALSTPNMVNCQKLVPNIPWSCLLNVCSDILITLLLSLILYLCKHLCFVLNPSEQKPALCD